MTTKRHTKDKIKIAVKKEPSISTQVTSSADEVVLAQERKAVAVSTDIIPSSDAENVQAEPQTVRVSAEVTSSADERIAISGEKNVIIGTDIIPSSDAENVQIEPRSGQAGTGISPSADEIVSVQERKPVAVSTEVVPSPDAENVQVEPQVVQVSTKVIPSSDEVTKVAKREAEIPPGNIVIAPDKAGEYQKFEDDFSGQWLPKGDPVRIGVKNYSTLENFRYTDFGKEGVYGYSKINAAAPYDASSVLSIKNGIQLKSNFSDSTGSGTKASYVLAQATDSTPTDKYIIQNTGTIPDARNFDWFRVETGINDEIEFVQSAEGAMVVTLDEASYTGATLATEIAAEANGLFTVAFTCTYSASTGKFTVDVATGTVYVDVSDSNAANTIGFTTDPDTASPIVSDISVWGASDYLATETSGAGLARFSLLPNGHVGICDGKNNYIWAGPEMNIAAFIECDTTDTRQHSLTDDNQADYTERIQNFLTTDYLELSAYTGSGSEKVYLIGTTRPAKGFYFRIVSGYENTTASTATMKYWDGDSFAAAAIVDGTDTGATLAQDGWMMITTPPTDIQPYPLCGYFLYFYELVISAKSANDPRVYNITARCDMQTLKDIWDGQERTCIKFIFTEDGTTTEEDKTVEVAQESYVETAGMTADLAALDKTAGHVRMVFSEPIVAIKVKLKTDGNSTNTNATDIEVRCWQAGDWTTAVQVAKDTTLDTATRTKTLNRSGLFNIQNDTPYAEQKTTINEVTGYAYRIEVSDDTDLDGEVQIDTIRGITRERTVKSIYKFPFMYKNRAMWCNSIEDKEYNRVDYSAYGAPDVYNGFDASGRHNERSLRFGSKEALTCAVELFNEYGDTVDSVGLFFKNTEAYLLSGDNPGTFRIAKISDSIGCPAPLSLVSAEVAYRSENAPEQNIALWLSDKGPMMFLGNTIRAIPGIEPYFDPNNTNYVGATYISEARGWYDHTYREYNLIVPNGAAAANILWFVYDLVRQKWYRKKPAANYPSGAFPVEDSNGNKYNYGYTSTGYLLKMENSLYWGDGSTEIENKIKTADLILSGSLWEESSVKQIRVLFEDCAGGLLTIRHYKDGRTFPTQGIVEDADNDDDWYGCKETHVSGTFATDKAAGKWTASALTKQETTVDWVTATYYHAMPAEIAMDTYNERYRSYLYNLTLDGFSHSFEIITNSCTTTIPKLLGWGLTYDIKEDILDRTDKQS